MNKHDKNRNRHQNPALPFPTPCAAPRPQPESKSDRARNPRQVPGKNHGSPAAFVDVLSLGKPPLPATRAEMDARGWKEVDVVLVSGDAYVDHPAFAVGILARVLEAAGYRVAVLAQPDWRTAEPWRTFGRPRLFFGVSAGNMDSMINHYTANKKVRNDDAYSPGGRIGLRPDRATLPYCQRAREAYPGVPVVAGGVEASLRRLAHYDYWSDTVRRSILLDSKADLVVYGMGEEPILEIARRLAAGETVRDLRDMRGVAYALGASEPPPSGPNVVVLPSHGEVKTDLRAFALATKLIHTETNPRNAKTLVQFHDRQAVVVNPPSLPLETARMDSFYDLPYTRKPHPMYKGVPVPAHEMIKDSVTIMRGCFGGCTFCSITAHQGRIIQSRSKESVLRELRALGQSPDFKGAVSDIGGPTANMYAMRCSKPEAEARCKRLSCVHPKICKLLDSDHGPIVELMREARAVPGVKRVMVASGVRMDLAQKSPEYLQELAAHHVGGQLKVAPEHVDSEVLRHMKKPDNIDFVGFTERFKEAGARVGKSQRVVPYFIASHPGSDLRAMIELALFLKRNNYRPDQVQDFIPAPFDIATCMYHTGLDPFTGETVHSAKKLRDRKLQRALLQFFKPENYFHVREALLEAGRADLIGSGPDCLIPANPPREARIAKLKQAGKAIAEGRYVHTIPQPAKSENPTPRGSGPDANVNANAGYRPKRPSARRRPRP